MKILKLLTTLGLTSLMSVLFLSSKSLANDIGTFPFNKYSSDIWIGVIEVEQGLMTVQKYGGIPHSRDGAGATTFSTETTQATKVTGDFGIPRCPNQYHTEGSIVVRYTNGEAYITRTYEINRHNEDERVRPQWTVEGYFGDPNEGKMKIETSITCVWHGSIFGF